MELLLALMLTQATPQPGEGPSPDREFCTTTNKEPIPLNGKGPTTVSMKCCPKGQYIKAIDVHGDLVCSGDYPL
jgi:hypothetical protein